MKAYLGQIVQTKKHGYIGRVYKKDYCCQESQEWLKGQTIPVTEEELTEPWYHLLVHDGGAVVVSESDLKHIDFDVTKFKHTYNSFYFKF